MKLKIGVKLGLGFGIMLVLIILLGATSFWALESVKNNIDTINQANNRLVLEYQLENEYLSSVAAIRGYIAYGDDNYITQTTNSLNKTLNMENDLLQIARADKRQGVQRVIDNTSKYKDGVLNSLVPMIKQYFAAQAAGNNGMAQNAKNQFTQVAKTLFPLSDEITQSLQAYTSENNSIMASTMQSTRANADSLIAEPVAIP